MTDCAFFRGGAQRSKYDDGSGPIPGPAAEALATVRATYDRALSFIAGAHEPAMHGLRTHLFAVGKSLMVDEASTSLQQVEAVLGKDYSAIEELYETYEFPSTHEKLVAAASADCAFFMFL